MWLKNEAILLNYRRSYVRNSTFWDIGPGCDWSSSDSGSCTPQDDVCPCELSVRWIAENHNNCVEARTNSSTYEFTSVKFASDLAQTIDGVSCHSRSITNLCTPGTFDIQFRWDSGHSPYPGISKMTIIVFGTRVRDNEKMPCACEDRTEGSWETVARVTINEDRTWHVEKIGGAGPDDSGSGDNIGNIEEDDVQ